MVRKVYQKKEKQEGRTSLASVSSAFLGHAGFLKKYLARFLESEQDIEDVVQEAYLKAYTAEQQKGEIEHPKAFLFSIAKNIAINELNKKSRVMTSYLEDSAGKAHRDTVPGSDLELEGRESLAHYCEAVACLPEKCRRVYILRKVHGLKHQEIADRLGITRSAVEKHISYGMLRCRDKLRELGQHDL